MDVEKLESQFEDRNEALRHVIDVLASYDAAVLDTEGTKAEIAREHDVEYHRIHYVMTHWRELVEYRRTQNLDPLDSTAVQQAYDDEDLAEMAGQPVADGMGDVDVTFTMPLDKTFRAIKLLPGDLGMTIFAQVLEQADELPRSGLDRLFD